MTLIASQIFEPPGPASLLLPLHHMVGHASYAALVASIGLMVGVALAAPPVPASFALTSVTGTWEASAAHASGAAGNGHAKGTPVVAWGDLQVISVDGMQAPTGAVIATNVTVATPSTQRIQV